MQEFNVGDRVTFHYWDSEYFGYVTAINGLEGRITVDVGEVKPFLLLPRDLKLVEENKEPTKSFYKVQDKFIEASTIEEMLQALNIEYKRYTEA